MGGEQASGGYGVGEYGVWVVSKLLEVIISRLGKYS